MQTTGKRKQGLACLSPERRQEIACLGGTTSQALKKGHHWTVEEASVAGKRGAASRARKRKENNHANI